MLQPKAQKAWWSIKRNAVSTMCTTNPYWTHLSSQYFTWKPGLSPRPSDTNSALSKMLLTTVIGKLRPSDHRWVTAASSTEGIFSYPQWSALTSVVKVFRFALNGTPPWHGPVFTFGGCQRHGIIPIIQTTECD